MPGDDENPPDEKKQTSDEEKKDVAPTPVAEAYNIHPEVNTETSIETPEETPALASEVLASEGFKFIKQLRPGGISGGSLDIYEYSGEDPEIKSLLNHGMLLLKTKCTEDEKDQPDNSRAKIKIENAKITFNNEWENINLKVVTQSLPPVIGRPSVPLGMEDRFPSLLSRQPRPGRPAVNLSLSSHNHDDSLQRPRLLAVQYGGHKFIMNECIYYNFQNKDCNLENYISDMGVADAQFSQPVKNADPPSRSARVQDRTKTLDKLFISMIEAQNELHQHGFLHLDTAPRNYCMTSPDTVKIIDFGNSWPMKPNGQIDGSINYIIIPTPFFDKDALKRVEDISIKTDLFARRMAMMETLARYMGHNTETSLQQLYFNGLWDPNKKEDMRFLLGIDNNARLSNMFENLRKSANELEEKDIRRNVVIEQLDKYKLYLTTLPEGPDIKLADSSVSNFETNDSLPKQVNETEKSKTLKSRR